MMLRVSALLPNRSSTHPLAFSRDSASFHFGFTSPYLAILLGFNGFAPESSDRRDMSGRMYARASIIAEVDAA